MNQIYDTDLDDDVNHRLAEEEVEEKFRKPLSGCVYPPPADVCFEGKCWLINWRPDGSAFNPSAALHSQETGKHQDHSIWWLPNLGLQNTLIGHVIYIYLLPQYWSVITVIIIISHILTVFPLKKTAISGQ